MCVLLSNPRFRTMCKVQVKIEPPANMYARLIREEASSREVSTLPVLSTARMPSKTYVEGSMSAIVLSHGGRISTG